MAATSALANRHIVSTILHQLSDMKYKVRRQFGPDQPVEFLEFRPTLVPAILVNKLWADEGTSILWKRYPHLPALKTMDQARRQYYANKVHQIFSMSPPPGHSVTLDYQDDLQWTNLKSLELEVDFLRHGAHFLPMIHPGLEHLEISGPQSGGPEYFTEVLLPSVFTPCRSLQSIKFGPGVLYDEDTVDASVLYEHLDSIPSLRNVELKGTSFMDKDSLFTRLSQRAGLEGLEIDLDPGIALLPQLGGPNALPLFTSLKRLTIMCYPEIALALPSHLALIEELQFDVCRVPEAPAKDEDLTIFEDLLAKLSNCPQLKMLKVAVGAMAINFPSFMVFPKLSGASLLSLASNCPKLEDLKLLATEPSAIDGSDITSENFDMFCQTLPRLRNISLKLSPTTATALEVTALQSLGNHCRELELVRLKLPFQLPILPVPSHIPRILIDGGSSPNTPTAEETFETSFDEPNSPNRFRSASDMSGVRSDHETIADFYPLFPRLTHLAIARPESILLSSDDTFTNSSASCGGPPSEILDPDLEADLVRSWAHPLLAHFPSIEILEAWGDCVGQDNESLNYFLPTEEILASTWEFLSGAEQDLWDDEEEIGSWKTYESGEDWDTPSYVDSFVGVDDAMPKLRNIEEESEGRITPGRVPDQLQLFDTLVTHTESKPPLNTIHIEGEELDATPRIPTDALGYSKI
ncbi:uncharacterized protein BDR25DRAFT_254652 [Lindgomyces ingoldianus]|uniref:Uncharacterized protein n=1 Tax=Lindgomyces ingoldianus TaxID=673940 RepID=A0ACB6R6S6_9PLEO|nr:uncharacterized protein BDR25DRAFT_254652 [Lindgomyces ingoldianus]KAF2474475.1 hypothetical protein BDR25DRAFT_254652 [Lindgomyces ingoldianus]